MSRGILVLACLVSCARTAIADEKDKDPVKEKLFAAKVAYDKEMGEFRKQAEEWFDKLEERARKDGNKKLVDQVKADRQAFDENGDLPKGAPAALQQQPTFARKALDAAYTRAVKDYIKAKKDDEAAAMEKALSDFRKGHWKHVDSSRATFHDGYLQISPQGELPTVQKHTGGVEIVVVARTEAENIRLHAQRTARVIFNWEVNPRQLRVHRPDGNGGIDSGSLATAKMNPLKPNTWYTLKWRLTEDGMQISVDGRVVFAEQKRYDLTAEAPVTIKAIKSAIDVQEFRVTPLGKNR